MTQDLQDKSAGLCLYELSVATQKYAPHLNSVIIRILMGEACKAKLLKPDPDVEAEEPVTVVSSDFCNVR